MNKTNNKKKTSSTTNNTLNKYFNERTTTRPGTDFQHNKYSTGIKPLDNLIGGGFTPGTIVGLGGGDGVGKTTLLMDVSRHIVKLYDKYVLYFNVEGGLSNELIVSMNLTEVIHDSKWNPSGKLLISEASTIQQISEITKSILCEVDIALIIIDTATSVTNKKILELKDLGASKNPFGQDASMWSKALSSLNPIIRESQVCLVLLLQAREDITPKGTKTVPWGGKAIRHWTSVELWMKRKEYFDEDFDECPNNEEAIGLVTTITAKKNRQGYPFRSTDVAIKFGEGVSRLHLIWNQLKVTTFKEKGIQKGVNYLAQSGSWFHLRIPDLNINEKRQGKIPMMNIILSNYDRIDKYLQSRMDD